MPRDLALRPGVAVIDEAQTVRDRDVPMLGGVVVRPERREDGPRDRGDPDDRGRDQEDVQTDAGKAKRLPAGGTGAPRCGDGCARHASRSWKLFQTNTTIGTIGMPSRSAVMG